MRILIAGSSGFIGSELCRHLKDQGHDVIPLRRDPESWDPERGVLDKKLLEGFDVVMNLAGEPVAALRWTAAKKRRIRDSRIRATRLLAECINQMSAPPKVFISASAVGYYGSQGSQELTEKSPPGSDFLAQVCEEWEAAAQTTKCRVICVRFGHVLGKGGLLKKVVPLFRLGLGGKIGSGTHWMSWIAMEDLLRAVSFLIENPITGPVNIVSPNPVTNAQFTKMLAEALHRPAFCHVPAWILHLFCGKTADALFLSSIRVFPERLLSERFTFLYPQLTSSLLEKLS